MNEEKIDIKELYEEYKRLDKEIHIEAHEMKSGESVKVNPSKPEKMIRKRELANELLSRKNELNIRPEELYKLQEDAQ